MTRTAEITRTTGETDVRLTLGLDGSGAGTRRTGVGFFDHMLDLLARHGRLDLDVEVHGRPADGRPPHRRGHRASCSGRRWTARSATGPASAATATPSSRWTRRAPRSRWTSAGGRCCLWEGLPLPPGEIAGFEHELAEEFFRAVASSARLTLHVDLQAGSNAHHMIEACFKAFARALRVAVSIDPDESGVPSTKGTLSA